MRVEVPKEIIKKIKGIPNVQGILLTGSRALGKETKNSDWDFFVILAHGKARWRKTTKYKNTWLELFCNDTNQIKKEFKEDLIEGRGVTTYMFYSGEIVFDPKGLVSKLVKQAKANWKKGPSKLSREKIGWIDYDISTYIQDLEDCLHDNNTAYLLANYAVNEFINYYYRLGNVWMPRAKDRLENLRVRNEHLYNLVVKFNSISDWKQKVGIAIKIGRFIGNKYGMKLNGEVYIPAKKV